jgi:hypothetical protein
MADINEASKPLRIRLITGLIILALGVTALVFAMNHFGASDNTPNWFEEYFSLKTASALTKAQSGIIKNSAVITSAEAEDAEAPGEAISSVDHGSKREYNPILEEISFG